jgi:hypothetical protein
MSEPQIAEAFAMIAELGSALGVRDVNKLPGCWEHQVDEQWWIALNGHRETIKDSHGSDVMPFHAVIEFNGWPAGIISPAGGIIAAGSCANESTFIGALREAAAKASQHGGDGLRVGALRAAAGSCADHPARAVLGSYGAAEPH